MFLDRFKTILLTSFYVNVEPTRLAEYQECIRRNVRCKDIAEIILFLEGYEKSCQSVEQDPKIHIVPTSKRTTFNQLFDYANQKLKGRYVVVCNGDIWFDSESNLNRIVEIKRGAMWALTRCKYDSVKRLGYRSFLRGINLMIPTCSSLRSRPLIGAMSWKWGDWAATPTWHSKPLIPASR